MIDTYKYKVVVILNENDERVLAVYSPYTGQYLGWCHYTPLVESYTAPEEIDDYINSNMMT